MGTFRNHSAIAALILASCIAVAPVAASNSDRQPPPKPVVSLSTKSITYPVSAARESVDVTVVVSFPRCAANCPNQVKFAYVGRSSTGRIFHTGMVANAYRLQVRTPKPLCMDDEVLKVQAAAIGIRGKVESLQGTSDWLNIRCRPLSVVEVAHRDSFPDANHRTELCTEWGQKLDSLERREALQANLKHLATAIDSANEVNWWSAFAVNGADSLFTKQDLPLDTVIQSDSAGPVTVPVIRPKLTAQQNRPIQLLKGYRYQVVNMHKNRYTGRVTVQPSPTVTISDSTIVQVDNGGVGLDPRCRARMAAWEAQRTG